MIPMDGGGGGKQLQRRSTRDARHFWLNFVLVEVVLPVGLTAFGFWSLRRFFQPEGRPSVDAITNASLVTKLSRPNLEKIRLTDYERVIAESLVDPESMNVSFDKIGGLEHAKREIRDAVILPLRRPDLFLKRSRLVSAPRGVLLYGAPGTGKTMLAKAIAKESGAAFLNLRMSNLMNKYFGESNKLVASVFSLATKLAPSIIFIDEIDSFLRQRGNEESAIVNMKAEFMTLWDGLTTDSNAYVMVLGATNRPYDMDQAILRRMPRTFEIGLPDADQRLQILRLLLADEETREDKASLCEEMAGLTEEYSGSDLKELCRAALLEPIREFCQDLDDALPGDGVETAENDQQTPSPRPLCRGDFSKALQRVKPTGHTAHDYQYRERRARTGGAHGGAPVAPSIHIDGSILQQLAYVAQMTQQHRGGGIPAE